MIVNLSGRKISYGHILKDSFFIFFALSQSYHDAILVTSFWRSMNRNNRLSLITGAQTIWSALHLIAGATVL